MSDGEYEIPAEYMRYIAAHLEDGGVDAGAWLAAQGLGRGDLRGDGMLSATQVRPLIRSAVARSGEPAIGLFVGRSLVAASHGIVGAVAVNSKNVRQALEMVERFSGLRTSLFHITHLVDGSDARVTFTATQPLGDIERPLLEAVMLSITNVLGEITMGAGQLDAVSFPFPAPDYAGLAAEFFGCEVRYDAPFAGFVGPATLLDIPLRQADATAFEVLAQICQRELAQLTESQTLSARVRRLLLQRQNGFPSLPVVARQFHMTQRTLHRRLAAEGSSYREILESVRRTLAVEQLKSGHFGLDEIAYRLGYTDLSNFRRAFKRWEGVTPSVYRERLLS